MLVDNYEREDVFAPVPKLAQEIDPVLRKLDGLLDDDALYHQVRSDFGKRYRSTLVHGRHSTPVEVLLRRLILKHLYQWSYKETEGRVADSLVLRWFCRVAFHTVPDASTLWRWEQTLRPETVHELNDRVVQLARQARVTKGRKLRLDATCVQTTIHHPTDSGLLVDSVRVLSRFVQRAKGLVKDRLRNVQAACRSRLRSARQTAQTLHRQLRRTVEEKEAQQKALYQKLIQTTEQMVHQSRRVMAALGVQTAPPATRLLKEAQRVLPLIERVITQTLFAHPPNLVAGDRGVHSPDTEERLLAAGVKRVAIPASGKLSEERQTLERSRIWRRGYRWRAGIEGRIASLRRDFGWRKSDYHGPDGMERWLGLGVIASNLRRIALVK
jgi:IS5 family transposase